jgi:predicted membrane protein
LLQEEKEMRIPGQILVGALFIIGGLVLAVGAIFDVDVGVLCLPTVFILAGVWLLLRPYLIGPDAAIRTIILGNVRYEGSWQVTDGEIWMFVGDVRLDMSEAEIPLGETTIRLFAFVGDVRAWVPEGVGLAVDSIAFLTSSRMFGRKRESFFAPVHLHSDGYETAERRVRLDMVSFVREIRVERA